MSTPDLHTFIPGAPGAKGRPRFNRAQGRAFTPAKTVKYESYLKQMLAFAMDGQGTTLMDEPVFVEATFWMPEPKSLPKYQRQVQMPHVKRPDLDNLQKSLLDAFDGVVVRDDSCIWRVVMCKRYSTSPGVEVRVYREGFMLPQKK